MDEWGPATYGDRIARYYDDLHGDRADTAEAVERLATLAESGRVLELGIGTGRIALPLALRGLEIHGIEASEEMVAKLREKPGGDQIPVSVSDFADVAVEGSFSLIFVVFNTFFSLLTQDQQIRCFANVADHLAPGGRFVFESFVPDLSRFDREQRVNATRVELDWVLLDATVHHRHEQRIDSMQVRIGTDGIQMNPVRGRYAFPSELDLMARLAGLRLEARWGGWDRRPFSADSAQHVSVYSRSDA
jgi:SAM-dependent methyltransferase